MAGIELANLDDGAEQELDIGKAPPSVRFLRGVYGDHTENVVQSLFYTILMV